MWALNQISFRLFVILKRENAVYLYHHVGNVVRSINNINFYSFVGILDRKSLLDSILGSDICALV